jgi:hypothetical protein
MGILKRIISSSSYRLKIIKIKVSNSIGYRFQILQARIESLNPKNSNPNGQAYFSDANFPLVADYELGVWNRPNHHFIKRTKFITDEEITTEVWTDADGIRVEGINQRKNDQFDILVVGESNTWGQGVPLSKTYASLLGGRLGMSVANLGLIASSGVQNLLIVRRFLKKKPKLIIYGFFEEHFSSNTRRCPNIDSPVCLGRPIIKFTSNSAKISHPWFTNKNLQDYRNWYRDTSNASNLSRARRMYWRLRILVRIFAEKYIRSLKRSFGDWPAVATEQNWQQQIAAANFVVSEMKTMADSVGAKLVVVYLPIFFSQKILAPPKDFLDHIKKIDVLFIDMEPKWTERRRNKEPFYFAHDMHLNCEGHRDVAEEIFAELKLQNKIRINA